MKLEWTPGAIRDLDAAGEYVAQENPASAAAMAERVQNAVEYLELHPALGRPGRLHGSRELVVSGTPFIVIYRVRLDSVQVLRVLHHARKWF
ncbi:MAG TPA: type II toxin-antitoxin system RelE/ParE family toxin [Gammaproteobacteria bacterium]|nr:type II toxin-antitoxin system RelE/ParE family toxin [Gammaproteobacteria bacterium]